MKCKTLTAAELKAFVTNANISSSYVEQVVGAYYGFDPDGSLPCVVLTLSNGTGIKFTLDDGDELDD